MEPGHEDREYLAQHPPAVHRKLASMEPGHEDREYDTITRDGALVDLRLNGARS